MKNALLVIVAVLFSAGCTRMDPMKFSYKYFHDLYYYQYGNGIMLAYRTADSLNTVTGHEVQSSSATDGVSYQIVLLGRYMSEKDMQKENIKVYRLPDWFLGHYIELPEFKSGEDKVFYLDPLSQKQYLITEGVDPLKASLID